MTISNQRSDLLPIPKISTHVHLLDKMYLSYVSHVCMLIEHDVHNLVGIEYGVMHVRCDACCLSLPSGVMHVL